MNKYLKPKEVAELLRVDLETVRRLLRTGRLKGIKIGRQWRVREEDLLGRQEILNKEEGKAK